MGKSRHALAGLALSLVACAGASVARAQPITEDEVPPALRPWIPWVLDGYEGLACAPRESAASADTGGSVVCVWPSELRIEPGATGCDFAMSVTVDEPSLVALPGSPGAWPAAVRIDGRDAPVGSSGNVPVVRVEPGSVRIEGRIGWESMPETLAVPDDVARLVVVRDGEPAIETRSAEGALWLGAATIDEDSSDVETPPEADTVRIEVHRQLTDGSPLALETRLTIRVSGTPRELSLGDVLPEGAVPVDVHGDVPARLRPSGELTLQIRAGTLSVTILAFVAQPDAPLTRPDLPDPWPSQEVWVWVPNEAFRQVELTGVPGIDPDRTTLPAEWRSYSAYLFDPGATLTLATGRRGEPSPPPNELRLEREVWLDLDGGGATIEDTLRLVENQGFRIELSEGSLGRVSDDGEDLLITTATEGGRPGVEVRAMSATLHGEWRVEGGLSSFPAVGWTEDASSTSTELHVGPGWELVHAAGVDHAPNSWTDRWTLLGFFALLVISIALGRVAGPIWGGVAFVGLGLAWHEDGTPRWLWLTLAILAALHHVLATRAPERWLRRAYLVVLVGTVYAVVIFSAEQLTNALFPALAGPEAPEYVPTVEEETPEWLEEEPGYDEGGTGERHRDDEGAMGEERSRTTNRYGIEGPAAAADPHMAREAASEDAWSAGSLASNANWLDPTAVVQTGYGRPSWRWTEYSLSFDGPVSETHRISLYLAPPWATRLVALLRAAAMIALLVTAVRRRPQAPTPAPSASSASVGGGAAAAAAALALVGLVASTAHAQPAGFPSGDVLTDLGERLTADPLCADHCAEATSVRIEADGDELSVELEVSALADAIYPLPGPSDEWTPARVLLDGRPAESLVRLASGFIHVRVAPGTHTVRVEGSLEGRDALTLSLARAPRVLTVELDGWTSTGTGTRERPAESIDLRREVGSEPAEEPELPDGEPTEATDPDVAPTEVLGAGTVRETLPTWIEVERVIDIGVRWEIRSLARRRSPGSAPYVARIPLVAGESVTDASIVVDGSDAVVTFARGVMEVSWTSVLASRDEGITLVAPSTGLVSERWRLACSPLWHCETSGLAPTRSHGDAWPVTWQPVFDPWPGETLTVALTRPAPMEGRSTTIESATLHVTPGTRLSESSLEVSVRTSVATTVSITIPSGAEVTAVRAGGTDRPFQRDGDVVTVTLQPGAAAVTVEWQEETGWSLVTSTPAVSVGGEAVNLTLNLDVSSDRWVLWIGGPTWGPAVLFWPYLLVVLAAAYALSRRGDLIPKLHEWALLGLGLTQVSPWVAIFIVGLFFLLAWRRSDPLPGVWRFDLRQLGIVLYLLIWIVLVIDAVRGGLLGDPAMMVRGPNTWSGALTFFVDRTDGALPVATLVSLPVVVFRVLMFVWALWFAWTIVRIWAPPAWAAFTDGGLWRVAVPRGAASPTPPTAPDGALATDTTAHAAPAPAAAPEATIAAGPSTDAPLATTPPPSDEDE